MRGALLALFYLLNWGRVLTQFKLCEERPSHYLICARGVSYLTGKIVRGAPLTQFYLLNWSPLLGLFKLCEEGTVPLLALFNLCEEGTPI